MFRHFQLNMLLLLLSHFSRVRLCATPQMEAHQASPSPRILQARTLEWVAKFSNQRNPRKLSLLQIISITSSRIIRLYHLYNLRYLSQKLCSLHQPVVWLLTVQTFLQLSLGMSHNGPSLRLIHKNKENGVIPRISVFSFVHLVIHFLPRNIYCTSVMCQELCQVV